MDMQFAILMVVLVVAVVFAIGAHRAAERARRSERMTNGRFLLAFSGLMAKMAMADGVVSAVNHVACRFRTSAARSGT